MRKNRQEKWNSIPIFWWLSFGQNKDSFEIGWKRRGIHTRSMSVCTSLCLCENVCVCVSVCVFACVAYLLIIHFRLMCACTWNVRVRTRAMRLAALFSCHHYRQAQGALSRAQTRDILDKWDIVLCCFSLFFFSLSVSSHHIFSEASHMEKSLGAGTSISEAVNSSSFCHFLNIAQDMSTSNFFFRLA